jgi:hypothetical protein
MKIKRNEHWIGVGIAPNSAVSRTLAVWFMTEVVEEVIASSCRVAERPCMRVSVHGRSMGLL